MFQFPSSAVIAPGQMLIVANQASDFRTVYGFLPDYELAESDPTTPNLIKYTTWSNGSANLNNDADEVLLLDGSDNVVDVVAYGKSTYSGFQPAVADVSEGCSIQRYLPERDTNSSEDWIPQPAPNPGSPGASPAATGTPTATDPPVTDVAATPTSTALSPPIETSTPTVTATPYTDKCHWSYLYRYSNPNDDIIRYPYYDTDRHIMATLAAERGAV